MGGALERQQETGLTKTRELRLVTSNTKPWEFDSNKNVLDYAAALTVRLKKPIMPDTAEEARSETNAWQLSLLLYPALILFSIYTSSFAARRIEWSWPSFLLIVASTVSQAVFALPFIFRKICKFTGVNKGHGDGLEWGDAAFYEMPLATLRKIIEKTKQIHQ